MIKKRYKTVLLIDDLGDFRSIMVRTLSQLGYETVLATNGKEGVELLQEHQIDAVLLDYNLPDLYGMEILERLIFINEKVPVIMISAYGSKEIESKARQLGAYDFLAKPFDIDELDAILKKALAIKD
jgi:two-component system, NtrC family, response regulator AtoC